MSIKMSTLTKESGFSKSTILYYIKEGLLPKPKKPKPNLHLYSDNSIKILEFIKYLQEHFHYSIAEIKSIIEDNKIDFSSDTTIIINYLSAMDAKEKKESMQNLKSKAIKMGVDKRLFKEYKDCAKKLAKIEYEIGAKFLESNEQNQDHELQKILFDLILEYKPYIFNIATIKEHKKRVAKNIGEDQ